MFDQYPGDPSDWRKAMNIVILDIMVPLQMDAAAHFN